MYEGTLPNVLFKQSTTPGQFTYRLALKLTASRVASWQAASTDTANTPTDLCSEFSGLAFDGGRGAATVGATVHAEQDAFFLLTACTKTAWYRDADGDGYGDAASTTQACSKPTGYVADGTDCDDSDAQRHPTLAETCDGKDNDCDGSTDNGLTAPACALTVGVCSGKTERCGGAAGWIACDASDYGADWQASETLCDGQDNDCDGTTDTGLAAPACALTSGVCAGKTERCGGAAGWLACDASDYGADWQASETLCDGKDNDCDGTTDTGFAAPACALTLGVCAGKAQRCGGAAGWVACDASDYGADYEAGETRCDGKDNDCDGSTDNVLGAPACALTLGVCAGKTKRCNGAAGWIACTATDYGAEYETAETRCDGKDNDCNGVTDDAPGGCGCTPGVTPPRACGSHVGECSSGTQACEALNTWGACTGGTGPVAEVCNGKDDDCSGATDDALIAPACANQTGVCAGSTQRCGGAAGWLACDASSYGADYEASETLCDGKDNDCDGVTDPAELCGGTPPKPAYYLGGCGCGAESEPLLLLAALVPLLSLWHRRSPHRRPAR